MGFDDDLGFAVALPLAVPLPRGRRLGRHDLERRARQPAARFGAALGLEQCANIRTVRSVHENLVCGHDVCFQPAGAIGGWTGGRSLAAAGDKVKARIFCDDARQRDLVQLATGRTGVSRDRETSKDHRR